jgi:4-hydroxy-3-polyprenylbenzoate decarboxylase
MAVRRFVVGVTGASGSICARSVIRGLLDHPDVDRIHVILSRFSLLTINAELGASAHDEARALEALIERPRERGRGRTGSRAHSTRKLVLHNSGDMAAAISSGSHPVDGTLVLAFRETPLGLVHIDNMRRATLAGSIVFPLTPAFYNHPLDLEEIVANFTGRIFDLLHLPHNLVRRWGGSR